MSHDCFSNQIIICQMGPWQWGQPGNKDTQNKPLPKAQGLTSSLSSPAPPNRYSTPSPVSPLLSLYQVYLPSLSWVSFVTGQRNEAFQGEAGRAPELAQGMEQNCVTRRTCEHDGKKHNNIPSWCLLKAVRSVQDVFPFTPSNTLPLWCKGWLVLLCWPWKCLRPPKQVMLMHRWKGFKPVEKRQERASNPCIWAWI